MLSRSHMLAAHYNYHLSLPTRDEPIHRGCLLAMDLSKSISKFPGLSPSSFDLFLFFLSLLYFKAHTVR
jgi:hypothetical protein